MWRDTILFDSLREHLIILKRDVSPNRFPCAHDLEH